ncbi:MAG: transposase [Candidatus Melainabacteria bacterium]|nr:transposase [Candidatus Melainabacteria bacterium]
MVRHFNTKISDLHEQMRLDLGLGKLVEANFDGGQVCSDGGLLLLAKAEHRLELTELAAMCIGDKRRPDLVQHSVQKKYGGQRQKSATISMASA